MKPRTWTIPWSALIANDQPFKDAGRQAQLIEKAHYDKAIKALLLLSEKLVSKKHMVAQNALKDLGEEVDFDIPKYRGTK